MPIPATRSLPSRFVDAGASLLLGAACPGCLAPTARLCPDCTADLAQARVFRVQQPGPPTWAVAPYGDLWRRLVVAYKERSAWWLAGPLAEQLAIAVAASLLDAGGRAPRVALVPMPSKPRTVRERGLDTTAHLARATARRLTRAGLPASVDPCLRHIRDVADQSSLGIAGRHDNLHGALEARPRGGGVRVVLDDLTTTGASLAEACRALAAADAPARACAVVAATPRRRHTSDG